MIYQNNKEKHIIEIVDKLVEEMVDFTCRLVTEPSTVGHEMSVLTVMENQLEHLGFSVQHVSMDQGSLGEHPGFATVPWDHENRYNLVAVEKAVGTGGRSALFNGHLDVVSPEPTGFWQQDPFVPQIRDGWLYGRGAGESPP